MRAPTCWLSCTPSGSPEEVLKANSMNRTNRATLGLLLLLAGFVGFIGWLIHISDGVVK